MTNRNKISKTNILWIQISDTCSSNLKVAVSGMSGVINGVILFLETSNAKLKLNYKFKQKFK